MAEYLLLLACDLDRTIFPNGSEPLSVNAKSLFRDFLNRQNICLAYVSGRSLKHALSGMKEYDVPFPHIYIGDVGTSIYVRDTYGAYVEQTEWKSQISLDWGNIKGKKIHSLISDIPLLIPQQEEHQNTFKQSYYFPEGEKGKVVNEVRKRLSKLNIKYEIVIHTEHETQKGYLDIIPSSATKECALRYLQEYLALSSNDVVFAGDGGNDLAPLTSGYKAIVVNNATVSFKEEVKKSALEKGTVQNIYFARGGYKDLNGNYIAGIVEGLNYFGFIFSEAERLR